LSTPPKKVKEERENGDKKPQLQGHVVYTKWGSSNCPVTNKIIFSGKFYKIFTKPNFARLLITITIKSQRLALYFSKALSYTYFFMFCFTPIKTKIGNVNCNNYITCHIVSSKIGYKE